MFIILLTLLSFSNVGRAHSPCVGDLTVTSRAEHRLGTRVDIFEFANQTRTKLRLEVTTAESTLGDLEQIGLRRRARAARSLHFNGPLATQLSRPVRVAHLRFHVPLVEDACHRDLNLDVVRIRDEFAADFEARRILLDHVVEKFADRDTVYLLSFASEPLFWRELEDLVHLGPTRFPAATWIADVLRPRGVRGAMMIPGDTLPSVLRARDGGIYRFNFKKALDQGWGPEILLFQPARR